MAELSLTGLKSGAPIGFMAALGAFRHAVAMPELGGVKLKWTPYSGQWCATFVTGNEIAPEDLVRLFVERVKGMKSRPEFEWSEAIKSSSLADYLVAASSALDQTQLIQWFAAFGTQLVLSDDGKIESTPLDMTVSAQKLLALSLELHKDLGKSGKGKAKERNGDSFREALFEEWRYADNWHSRGWDPGTLLLGALTPEAPTKMKKAGVRAAVWLAMECLPLMPCVYDGSLAASGFRREGRKQFFVWPVWEAALSMLTVKTILSQLVGMSSADRRARHLAAIYESRIYKPSKYLATFQPATLIG
jgi:hypothetical protein